MGADPSCETGIIDHNTCCARECGTCDGIGCGRRPGGAADCCGSKIASVGKHCDENNPPCLLPPSPVPPGPPPASTATLTLNTAVGIARVHRKYVSFTFDSSAWREYDLSGSGLVGGSKGPNWNPQRCSLPTRLHARRRFLSRCGHVGRQDTNGRKVTVDVGTDLVAFSLFSGMSGLLGVHCRICTPNSLRLGDGGGGGGKEEG